MIKEFVQRPASRHRSNFRPITGKASEENEKLSNQCFETAKKHMTKKQLDQAIKHYTNATIHNPYNFKALCNLGSVYKSLNKFAQARNCYHRALFANPNDFVGLYNLGNLQRISGNDEQAIFLYEKVVNLKQKQNVEVGQLHYDALINQAICYKNLRLYDEAVRCNDKAIQLRPKDEAGYFNKGMCMLNKIYSLTRSTFVLAQKQFCIETVPLFKKVLQINSNNTASKIALIQLKYLSECSQQNLKSSIKQFEELSKVVGESDKHQILFKIKYCQNQLQKLQAKKKQAQKEAQKLKDNIDLTIQKNKPVSKQNKFDVKQDKDEKKNQKQKPKQKIVEPPKQNKQPTQPTQPTQPKTQQTQQKNENKNKNQNPVQVKKQGVAIPQYQQSLLSNEKALQMRDQGKSPKQIIQYFIQQKNFPLAYQATLLLQASPLQRHEYEIIINYLQFLQNQQENLLRAANSIYRQHILKNDQNKKITKQTCSQKGHEYIATMLNVLGDYTQASKHYQVLLAIIQDQKFNQAKKAQTQEKIKQIHAELGVCYAERGLLSQAIKQYQSSLKMQPDNYFLMTNLCGLLIQNNQNIEAKKYYQEYLKKNNGENMQDKASYIDSLLNISICVRDTPEQQKALTNTIQALQKHFPSYQQIKSKLHEEAVLGIYLRQAQILEKKCESIPQNSLQKRQMYGKMLDSYLTCLQFQNCPDRQAMSINSGILFYLNGCYINALNFYRTVVMNRKLIENNLGLTYLHLQQYQRGLTYLDAAVKNNPNNIVYNANFQIAKWICGLNDKNLIYNYPCKCQTMQDLRQSYGLWLLEQLTNMIDSDQISLQAESSEQAQKEAQNLIKKLIQKSLSKEGLSQVNKNKVKIVMGLYDKHIEEFHKDKALPTGTTAGQVQYVPSQIREICTKRYENSKQFQTNIAKIVQFLSKMSYQPQYNHTIVQASICLFFISNSHISQAWQLFRSFITAKKIFNPSLQNQKFQTTQFKKYQTQFIGKKVPITDPKSQLKYSIINNTIRDAECLIQNLSQYLMEHIQAAYYAKTDTILLPLIRQYRVHHCQDIQQCVRCMLNSSHLYSALFGKKIFPEKVQKLQSTSIEIQKYNSMLIKFVQSNLQNSTNNVYNKQNKQLVVELTNKNQAFVLKTYHKKFTDVIQFITRISPQFKLQVQGWQNSSQLGVKQVVINKSLLLQLWWGQKMSYVERFCHWMGRRSTNYYYDALLLFGYDVQKYREK